MLTVARVCTGRLAAVHLSVRILERLDPPGLSSMPHPSPFLPHPHRIAYVLRGSSVSSHERAKEGSRGLSRLTVVRSPFDSVTQPKTTHTYSKKSQEWNVV
jgi:hypothetical protein